MLWIADPDVPSWWPLRDGWWLLGGAWTGVTLLVSCAAAYLLIGYSYRRFHGKPEALAALSGEVEEADEELHRR